VQAQTSLRTIKLVHTAVWAVFASAILAIPIYAWLGAWRITFFLIALVTAECLVLVFNRMRCPLTGAAARHTDERQENFDIYLPLWLARWNKHVFGTLFVLGLIVTLYRWRG
jgi:predicted MFS family arabinose efflux permease